jgi:hypothetical protein
MDGHEVRRKTFETLELLQSILVHLPVKQLYSVQRVSKEFQRAVLGCPLIRDKMFLNRSTDARETWKIMTGGHAGTHFQSVGHWLFLHKLHEPAGPMFQAIAPSDTPPLQTFTPAVLHPVFLNGPWDSRARNEALRSAPPACLHGPQCWVSAVMVPVTLNHGVAGARNLLLEAFTSDPLCKKAVVRVSHEMKSGIFLQERCSVQSEQGLKLGHVYNALDKLSRKMHCKAATRNKQTLIKRELRIFMPCDIHPVTTQEWQYVSSLRA